VVVPDNQLSLAIGKGGQNVRLASRLTGWKIDIKPESEVSKSLASEATENRLEELANQNEITDFDGFEDFE
jgi:N utilization substance protein A